jgi:ribose/xylose/arabinose/galactoside ABC-type transport system permease subunit
MVFILVTLAYATLAAALHRYAIEEEHISPHYWWVYVVRAVAIGFIAMLFHNPLDNLILGLVAFWFYFDVLLNLMRGKPIYHLGDKFIDGLTKRAFGEVPMFWWKFILFVSAIGIKLYDQCIWCGDPIIKVSW